MGLAHELWWCSNLLKYLLDYSIYQRILNVDLNSKNNFGDIEVVYLSQCE